MRPAVMADPERRFDLLPRSVVEPMFVMCVGVSFAFIAMSIVVPEDRPIRIAYDTGVIGVIPGSDLATRIERERLVDVEEKAMIADDTAVDRHRVTDNRDRKSIGNDKMPAQGI